QTEKRWSLPRLSILLQMQRLKAFCANSSEKSSKCLPFIQRLKLKENDYTNMLGKIGTSNGQKGTSLFIVWNVCRLNPSPIIDFASRFRALKEHISALYVWILAKN